MRTMNGSHALAVKPCACNMHDPAGVPVALVRGGASCSRFADAAIHGRGVGHGRNFRLGQPKPRPLGRPNTFLLRHLLAAGTSLVSVLGQAGIGQQVHRCTTPRRSTLPHPVVGFASVHSACLQLVKRLHILVVLHMCFGTRSRDVGGVKSSGALPCVRAEPTGGTQSSARVCKVRWLRGQGWQKEASLHRYRPHRMPALAGLAAPALLRPATHRCPACPHRVLDNSRFPSNSLRARGRAKRPGQPQDPTCAGERKTARRGGLLHLSSSLQSAAAHRPRNMLGRAATALAAVGLRARQQVAEPAFQQTRRMGKAPPPIPRTVVHVTRGWLWWANGGLHAAATRFAHAWHTSIVCVLRHWRWTADLLAARLRARVSGMAARAPRWRSRRWR